MKNKGRRVIAGFISGLCNGLFGAGGGIIAVIALEKICNLEPKNAHATALAIMLPCSLISIVIYFFSGALDWSPLPFVAPALAAGSFLGAKFLGKISVKWLNRLFSLLMLAAAVRLLI
ncbi:MAG: Sulfite exporter TauE/SafE [Firmicutes bacterium ADurb.Bin182]|nr:MAG: Sulfite exporter TauE/SafE [Firmicutes bacterium ADurb.Bin182]